MPPVENTRTAKVWTALRRMVSMSSAATDGEFHVWPSSVNSESLPLQSLPASNVCRLVSKTFKDSAGSAPDTWWPPDLQNVSQGRCGRQASKQASRQVGREGSPGQLVQTPRRCNWCTAASHSALHPAVFFTKGSTLQSAVSLCAGLGIFAARVSAIGSAPPPVWSQT